MEKRNGMSYEQLFGANKSPEANKPKEGAASNSEKAPVTVEGQAENTKKLEAKRAELEKLSAEEKSIDDKKEQAMGAFIKLAKGESVDAYDLQRQLGTTSGTGELAATGNVKKFVEDQIRSLEAARSQVNSRKSRVSEDIRGLERP